MNTLSAVIITKNEERNIERCLKSIKNLASEIVIVDAFSIDNTIKICENYDCKIFQKEWNGFGIAKKFAVEQTENDWVFSIDADEEVTESLSKKIKEILVDPKFNIYKIKRKSFFLGKEIKHCGWNRDYPKRLFNKNYGNFNSDTVHESVIMEGERGKIESPIFHYTYPTIKAFVNKMNLYSELNSEKLFNEGRKVTVINSIFYGFIRFIKMFFFDLGFLDGKKGFILCAITSYGVFLKYIKLWSKHNSQ